MFRNPLCRSAQGQQIEFFGFFSEKGSGGLLGAGMVASRLRNRSSKETDRSGSMSEGSGEGAIVFSSEMVEASADVLAEYSGEVPDAILVEMVYRAMSMDGHRSVRKNTN